MRNVRQIYRTDQHQGGDSLSVRSLFSHMGDDKGTNPFLMLDYAVPYEFAPNPNRTSRGVSPPHKDFETVTIAYRGEAVHRDSSGGGGVQWMTADSGIIHEEFHSKRFNKTGGLFEMVQLGVNLPPDTRTLRPATYTLPKPPFPLRRFPKVQEVCG